MVVVAVVCAYNEGPRIARVLDVLTKSPDLHRIIVVDDGSTDDTATVAKSFDGVEVIEKSPNAGKGQAMKTGVLAAKDADVVVFFDADLQGLTTEHVHSLVEHVASGEYDMIVGMRDYGDKLTEASMGLPLISGERAVRREFLDLMPDQAWDGFGVEVWMNDTVARNGGLIGAVPLEGLSIVLKWEKDGARKGLAKMVDMAAEVIFAMQKIRRYYSTSMSAHPNAQLRVRRSPGSLQASVGASIGPFEVPEPTTLEDSCTTTQCVTDALARSIVKAAAPFVREELWNESARAEVGESVGRKVALPLWVTAGMVAFSMFGGLGLAGIFFLLNTQTSRPER